MVSLTAFGDHPKNLVLFLCCLGLVNLVFRGPRLMEFGSCIHWCSSGLVPYRWRTVRPSLAGALSVYLLGL